MSDMPFRTFDEFWPYYLRQHAHPRTRILHFIGTTLAAWTLVASMLLQNAWLVLLAFGFAYAFAWAGHFGVEGNQPATFRSPLWSLRGDIRMYRYWLDGRLGAALHSAGIVNGGPTIDPRVT